MKVAIAGFGVEGQSAYDHFSRLGADITILYEGEVPKFSVPDDVSLVAGKNVLKDITGYDLIVRSPSLNPNKISTKIEVSSVTQEFFKLCPAPIIGITGSKGKGTTSTFIYDMLKAAGVNAHIAGNIGVPALDILPQVKKDDVVVLELSSFQLWDLKTSPQVAVVVMMEQEHLDVHASTEEYIEAKANITRWQKSSDITIYLPGNKMTEQVAFAGSGKKIPYSQAPGAYVKDENFIIDDVVVGKISDLKIPGEHNQDNACAAITAAWQFTKNVEAIKNAIKDFKGLEHRLSIVRELDGVRYFDDSIGTTPGSSIAAIKAFSEPKVLILGGSDKGADFNLLAKATKNGGVKAVVAIGISRDKIIKALKSANFAGEIVEFSETSNMKQIVEKTQELSQPGDVVILSPACASYDMFKSYADRGNQFSKAVQELV